MYPIDLNTCTAIDIIGRSIVCHPSLFREALAAAQSEDTRYGATREDVAVKRAVSARAAACGRAVAAVDNEDAGALSDDVGAGIVALNIACKLQCIPPHVRTAAALRTWPA